ncbi:hypothetical protein [Sulfitobacter guttiformis]|uniref:Uncharacterized protein n=1 Tax=Sulfitobacter guttiformis TaxID=74349 RepID=A0A420DHK8_9RHOB|nr:hypothetical protein [Sulfitobacter guttiformis]KIN72546.1 hypothetical protein Z949_1722 [Sulfitobacter guttiformis KCTC 32187]RKE93709.1 hypothetical protein C8N30_2800 [Sulfitobacter guttiformis]
MPRGIYVLMLLAVIAAGGLTAWLVSVFGPDAFVLALPVFMIATIFLNRVRK